MQEHSHEATTKRIISQSYLIWFGVAVQLALNIYTISLDWPINRNSTFAILLVNVIFSLLNVPGVILFIKYYRYSAGKIFTVTYNALKLADKNTGKVVEIKTAEIEKIYLVVNVRRSRFPWSFHEYFKFVDVTGKEILVTSYFMNISEFWLDSLTGKVSSSNLITQKKILPLF